MRLGIAWRLALVLALVGALAAGFTGFYVYQASSALVVAAAQNRLLTSTHVVKRRITHSRESISRDLQVLSEHPLTQHMLQRPDAMALDGLHTLFKLRMQVNPGYMQIRLMAAQNFGLEVVRVDRDALGPITVQSDDLQEKAHFSYVSQALKLSHGETYISQIVINHERGAHLVENKPTVVMSMPVHASTGRAIGVVAISIDVQGMFDLMAQDLPPDFQLYLANGVGDILIHPDSRLTFGFDRGQRQLLQDHMPPTAPMVRGELDERVFELPQGPHTPEALLAAFVRQEVRVSSDERHLLLGLAQPVAVVLAEVERLRLAIVNIVLALSVACLVVAVVLARALSKPINGVGRAAQMFAQGQLITELPTERNDEIGDLARSFSRMQTQIVQQLEELELSRRELSDQARHDGLTGLANRRLFAERLAAALAHRRRHGGEVALLFVDLDRFKGINDTQGHEAGDAVLKAVASRLRANTREVDTPARLGGDEFVVLLSGELDTALLSALASKLAQAVSAPVPYGEHLLQVGCSIGIGRTPVDGDTADQLLAAADQAMYAVKSMGRNGVRFATPTPDAPSQG